jgi:hypothetical protein
MLYNESTGKPKVQTDVFSLASLIAWLETMPANEPYCYSKNGDCMFAKYFNDHGFLDVWIGGRDFRHSGTGGKLVPLPDHWPLIAVRSPNTFGAALDRARKALAA